MKFLYKFSKWFHKYIGLLLLLFLVWMSFSGIILNHPELINRISISKDFVPGHYHLVNWSRSSLTTVKYSGENRNRLYAAGNQGVWKSTDGGLTFSNFRGNGFPMAEYDFKTKDLYLDDTSGYFSLLAATSSGLYRMDRNESWQKIKLGSHDEPVMRLLQRNGEIIAFTESGIYKSIAGERLSFKPVNARRSIAKGQEKITLVQYVFDLHGGRFLGLPGKILFDIAGLVIIFLCVASFYTWYYPKMLKRKRGAREGKKYFRFFWKYHYKLGIWSAAVLLIIAVTGFLMRPPVLALITDGTMEKKYYPGFLPENPWDRKIRNALYDEKNDRFILDCTDGTWSGRGDLSSPFEKITLPAPVFVMGATVFDTDSSGNFIVGSFSGIFRISNGLDSAFDFITGKPAIAMADSKPSDMMVTGYFKTPEGDAYVNTYEQGLISLNQDKISTIFQMPPKMSADFKMPLWNYMFEIHNARFFKGIIGPLYILAVPLGSLLFILILLSGIFDWLWKKIKKKGMIYKVVQKSSVSLEPSEIDT